MLLDTSLNQMFRSATPTEEDNDDKLVHDATQGLLGLAGGSKRQAAVIVSDEEDGKEDEVQMVAPYVDETEDEQPYEEDEDPEFAVDFLVLGDNGAADEIPFLSIVNASRFFRKVVEAMEVDQDDMHIAYKFLMWKAADLPLKLKTSVHLEGLFSKAKTAMNEVEASKSKVKKCFQVIIVNLELKEKTEKKGGKKAKGKPKKGEKNKKHNELSDSEDDGDGPKRKSGADYHRDLQAKHKCDKHGGFCLVASGGEHVPLGAQKMSLWSLLMVEGGHKSDTEPPAALNIDLKGTKAAAPTRRTNQTAAYEAPPYPSYHYYPPPPPGIYPHPPYYPPQPPAHAPHPPPHNVAPTATITSLRKGPSVDSQADDSPILYPKIEEWFLELDMGERGEDGHGFHKFGQIFRENGYTRVIQLADEGEGGVAVLPTMCAKMPMGTAKLIMKYAIKDCKEIWCVERANKAAWAAVP
ncbi:hypothetical protein B0H19DRAFT_1250335 [Mycena capillaripes]|nr:hypothetical protein B0H19DRAFT_1250335 [Mycena capillaripes]